MRERININRDWVLKKTEVVPERFPVDWESVHLPHTWNALDGQDGGNDYWRGTAMYCKELEIPYDNANRIYLEFLGAAMTACVYVNGTMCGKHEGGYSTFRIDITDLIQTNNWICVSVDNGENDRVYPQKADFTFYGGLYRDVNLMVVPEKHFELCKDGTPGIKVTPIVHERKASVTVETWQNGDGKVTIFVAEQSQTVSSVEGYAKAEFLLEDVHLWDGVDDPYLYTASAEFGADRIETRFGCRSFAFDTEKGFILNGRSYPLRGVCRHQDRAEIGNALTIKEHMEDMEIVREIGANTIRLAHYQQAQEFYDLCDEYGIVVWAEIPYISWHMPNGRQNTLNQMRELITQCYNHPSIICWGLSNEITASGPVTEDMLENHRLLNELCHEMDPVRVTTMAHVFTLEIDSPLADIPDVGSYNLYYGWYMGECEQNDDFFDNYHKKFPKRMIGLSEYGADANPLYQTAHPDKGDYSEQYQSFYHEQIYGSVERHPYIWASHLWNLFDFAADGRNEGGNNGKNQKGLVTMDRKLKKDAFYFYKATWSKEPFIHICGRRYIERTEDVTQIKVYSNLNEVELYCDGKPVEKKSGCRIFEFELPIDGEHEILVKSGVCADTIQIRKVGKQNQEYVYAKAGSVSNWFETTGFKEGYYSVKDTFGSLQKDPRTAAVIAQMMDEMVASRGDVAKKAFSNPVIKKMLSKTSLESLIKQAGNIVKPEQAKKVNELLQQIPKEGGVS